MPRDSGVSEPSLQDLIEGPPPPGIAALPPTALADLTEAVRGLYQRQHQEYERTGDAFVDLVPRPFRGLVKRIAGL